MRKIAVLTAVAATLVSLASPLAAQEPPANAAAAMSPSARSAAATVDAFHAALRRGDTAAAAALLADDALIFEAGGVEHGKAEYAAHHLPADAEFAKLVASLATRRAGDSNGDWAWVASEGRTTGTYKGKAIDQATTETMLLRRDGQAWKIVHIHWSSGRR
jgi:ketosteroid isomerase-like protein